MEWHPPSIDLRHKTSLGVAVDMVMTVASNVENSVPDTVPHQLLKSRRNCVDSAKEIDIQATTGQDITTTRFPDFVDNVRFNLKYMQSIFDLNGCFQIYRNEKVVFQRLTLDQSEVTWMADGNSAMYKQLSQQAIQFKWAQNMYLNSYYIKSWVQEQIQQREQKPHGWFHQHVATTKMQSENFHQG